MPRTDENESLTMRDAGAGSTGVDSLTMHDAGGSSGIDGWDCVALLR